MRLIDLLDRWWCRTGRRHAIRVSEAFWAVLFRLVDRFLLHDYPKR